MRENAYPRLDHFPTVDAGGFISYLASGSVAGPFNIISIEAETQQNAPDPTLAAVNSNAPGAVFVTGSAGAFPNNPGPVVTGDGPHPMIRTNTSATDDIWSIVDTATWNGLAPIVSATYPTNGNLNNGAPDPGFNIVAFPPLGSTYTFSFISSGTVTVVRTLTGVTSDSATIVSVQLSGEASMAPGLFSTSHTPAQLMGKTVTFVVTRPPTLSVQRFVLDGSILNANASVNEEFRGKTASPSGTTIVSGTIPTIVAPAEVRFLLTFQGPSTEAVKIELRVD